MLRSRSLLTGYPAIWRRISHLVCGSSIFLYYLFSRAGSLPCAYGGARQRAPTLTRATRAARAARCMTGFVDAQNICRAVGSRRRCARIFNAAADRRRVALALYSSRTQRLPPA